MVETTTIVIGSIALLVVVGTGVVVVTMMVNKDKEGEKQNIPLPPDLPKEPEHAPGAKIRDVEPLVELEEIKKKAANLVDYWWKGFNGDWWVMFDGQAAGELRGMINNRLPLVQKQTTVIGAQKWYTTMLDEFKNVLAPVIEFSTKPTLTAAEQHAMRQWFVLAKKSHPNYKKMIYCKQF